MPSSNHAVELHIPKHKVWEFVSDLNNWAPLMPGYIAHEHVDEQEATWEFLGDFGFMKKKVSLKLDRIIRVEELMITFDLEGINDNFEGSGYFEVKGLDQEHTVLTGSLDISSGGFMGAMVNNVLKTSVPQTTKELVQSIGRELQGKAVS
ncbi:CoxG family protein [Bacillus massiliigorillae]|uniref:CoxG family protein n=1 Tax=Bacillus massiliigorillae TaxID=1243664 RepID=UPI0003A2DB63|nr:SRPBCC family protein [Bacillus massiliigorillae]